MVKRGLVIVCAAVVCVLGGCCSNATQNASFAVSECEAERLLAEMKEEPVAYERPVVVLGGWLDPGWGMAGVARVLEERTTDPEQVIAPPYLSVTKWESMRERVITAVERAYPSGDDEWTVEVDVVGISMGGLVARYCAMGNEDGVKRLRIRNLYTIASPHKGADRAAWPTIDPRVLGMRAGSEFLSALDAGYAGEYEVFGYVRLGDVTVGEGNTVPPGGRLWWVPNRFGELAHNDAQRDPRILADVVLRLRGEGALTREPATPLESVLEIASAEDEGGESEDAGGEGE